MIQVQTFIFNPFMENTFVVFDETNNAIVIDPGCYEKHENNELKKFILSNDLKVLKLINTHCHIDHCLGNDFVKSTWKVPLSIHKKEDSMLRAIDTYASSYGFAHYKTSEPDNFLEEGDIIEFGNSSFEVLFVPGHSPGHIALINKEQNLCISGDVLFDGGIGRTDLPGGNFDTLIQSINNKLFIQNDNMVVYSGHGNTTTIGKEKVHNPFCGINSTIN